MWIRRCPLTWFALLAALLGGAGGGVGCSQPKTITIGTTPPGATLIIDGVESGRAPITREFGFTSNHDVHRISAKRIGYKDRTITIDEDERRNRIVIDLEPNERDLTFHTNVPAQISID